MMELWEACFFVLILDLTFGKDISSNLTFVTRNITSCPDVGYFFKREPSPNLVASGPCFLCFCKDNAVATCWVRDQRRCDVERYHHHRVGRQTRFRRGFSDVFLRDATRPFFGKTLPTQCKPYESSFSDGCPPVDWCIGCTICDCDANGRWDCHILSFCDGKEGKKKVKPPKHIRRKIEKSFKDYDYSVEVKKETAPTPNTSKKPMTTPKKTRPPKKKVVKAKPVNKTNNRQRKTTQLPKNSANKHKPTKRQTRIKAMSKNRPKTEVSRVKNTKKMVTTRKPQKNEVLKNLSAAINLNEIKWLNLDPGSNETLKLGKKIVDHVLSSFHKIFAKEIDKLNEIKKVIRQGCETKAEEDLAKKTNSNVVRRSIKHKRKRRRHHADSRRKREILNYKQAYEETNTIITLTTDLNAVIPLDTIKEKSTFSTNSQSNVTLIPQSTLQGINYDTYSIKNDSYDTSTNKPAKNSSENIENEITNSFVIPVEINNDLPDKTINNNTKAISSDINDLFTNRYTKIKNDEWKRQFPRLLLIPLNKIPVRTTQSFQLGNKTDKEKNVSKLQKENSKHDATEKYSLTTLILSKVHKKPCCTKAPRNFNKTDVTILKNIIPNLFTDVNKTKTAKRKQISNFSVKYIRKLFHKIFYKMKTGNRKVYGLGTKEDHTLQILCENIGPCKINKRSRFILKYKLKQLNKETKIILKSISTVKGLLHLLELPERDKISYETKNNSLQNDIQKLGIVLKNYKDSNMNSPLTFTQKMQIDYIKNNTQKFIESVKKFAEILTDILVIIKPNYKSSKYKLKQQNYTASLNKIKRILYQYNILQNSFMRKMYKLIRREETKASTTEKTQILGRENNQNDSDDEVDKYTKNIFEHLRKLKNIAQVLSSKRKKRDTMMRDDALEYLLMLMEILIKQNQLSDTVRKNDGLDLLIDAIKNAPEISLIHNKDLENAPVVPFYKLSNTTEVSGQLASDSNSESKRISKEESATDPEDNVISRDNFIGQGSVNEQDNVLTESSSKFAPVETQNIDDNDDDVTKKVHYRRYNQPNNNGYEATTEYDGITNKRSNNVTETIGFDKFESFYNDPKKLDTETAYGDDDTNGDVTTDSVSVVTNSKYANDRNVRDRIAFKSDMKANEHITRSNESSSESQDSDSNRTKLEWIEESFDREIRMINNSLLLTQNSTSTQPTSTSTEVQIKNNSDITEENHIEDNLSRLTKKSTAGDVQYEKQVQFLNSLDYGTEKSPDLEESDSKDDAKSDDSFPAYFV